MTMKEKLNPFTTSKLVVVLEKPHVELALQKRLMEEQLKVTALEKQVNELTNKYGYESYLNNELLDYIREAGIKVRPGLLKHF